MQDNQQPDVAIFEADSSASQSMHALMIAAQDLKLLTYLMPVDMRDERQVLSAVKLIWRDINIKSKREVEAHKAKLPDQDKPAEQRGQYYLVVIKSEDGNRLHVMIPEGHVVPQAFMLAAKAGKSEALRLRYRHGLLPTA